MPLTTRHNPGAFASHRVGDPRRLARRVIAELRRGRVRSGLTAGAVELANLWNEVVGARRRPRFRCTCCGHVGYAFTHRSNELRVAWNSSCPRCDSRSRHRGLAALIPRLLEEHGRVRRVLHVAPEPILARIFEARPELAYETTDLHLEDVTHPGQDLQALTLPSDRYDLVLCNHVIEHLPDDAAAVGEIARILTPTGLAVVTIPGDYRREETVRFAAPTHNGHHRDYGLDAVRLFERAFARVRVVDLHELDRDGSGLSRGIRPLDVAFVMDGKR